jgi:HEPN domain-containing protein
MTPLTREWVGKAEDDMQMARVAADKGSSRLYDGIGFHCQQASEKYLKALLQEAGRPAPKTHNLVDLLTLLTPVHPTLRPLRRGLKFLTRFAVDHRYPGKDATKRQAEAAIRWADRVRTACRTILGLKVP